MVPSHVTRIILRLYAFLYTSSLQPSKIMRGWRHEFENIVPLTDYSVNSVTHSQGLSCLIQKPYTSWTSRNAAVVASWMTTAPSQFQLSQGQVLVCVICTRLRLEQGLQSHPQVFSIQVRSYDPLSSQANVKYELNIHMHRACSLLMDSGRSSKHMMLYVFGTG